MIETRFYEPAETEHSIQTQWPLKPLDANLVEVIVI